MNFIFPDIVLDHKFAVFRVSSFFFLGHIHPNPIYYFFFLYHSGAGGCVVDGVSIFKRHASAADTLCVPGRTGRDMRAI